jgi:hypothetical protein
MTSFAHVDYPTQHPGVIRAERAVQNIRAITQRLDRGTAAPSVFLAALVAALLVVANQLVETWSDGHLLVAWVLMWTIAFAAIAVFAAPIRRVSASVQAWFKRGAAKRRQAREDAQLWHLALNDDRIMADLSRAMSSAAVVRNLKTFY